MASWAVDDAVIQMYAEEEGEAKVPCHRVNLCEETNLPEAMAHQEVVALQEV